MDKKNYKIICHECGTDVKEFRIPIHSSLADEEWEYGITRRLRPLGWNVTLPGHSIPSELQSLTA